MEILPPTHDILPIPSDLDEETLVFVLEHLGQIALDFGLEALQTPADTSSPESIDAFIKELEEKIKSSSHDSSEKDKALQMLGQLIEFYKNVLEQTRRSNRGI